MDNERQKRVLEAVIRFGPRKQKELTQLVPEYKPTEITSTLEELKKRGFITLEDEEKRDSRRIWEDDVVQVNTDPFNIPSDGQQGLVGQTRSEQEIVAEKMPNEVDTSETITLELTPEQTELFERMRTDVSRTCGTMTQEEFMDWVLREARRMTEV